MVSRVSLVGCPMSQSSLHIVLCQPEIPPNTGNIIRLCANTGAALHMIEPLGFEMDDKRLRRAGLDYHEFASVQTWDSLPAYATVHADRRLIAIETCGETVHSEVTYQHGDSLVFGSETKGLSDDLLALFEQCHIVRLPMLPGSRSLNLSNAVAVAVFEAWRQLDFAGRQ
jgi:tRNA (cytidine/uridine-2'-O-)-methyltransferase